MAGPIGQTLTIETGEGERLANMYAFAEAGLKLAVTALK